MKEKKEKGPDKSEGTLAEGGPRDGPHPGEGSNGGVERRGRECGDVS